jgi:hypothetical protein
MILKFQAFASGAAMAGILLLTGCGDEPKPVETKVEKKKVSSIPTGPITGLTAYYEMYKVARSQAPDIQTASLTGNDVEGTKSEEGKFPMWTAVFVSASTQAAITYTYSTVESGNTLRGINSAGTMKWAGPTRDAEPFSNSDFSVDSDAAYKAAMEKAGDWVAKNPGKPVTTFALGQSPRFPAPMWYVVWGNAKTGGFAVFVNALTGKVMTK